MTSNSFVNTIITFADGEIQSGKFRWRLEIAESEALRIVLDKLSDAELKTIKSIDFVPASNSVVFIPWLKRKRVYEFTQGPAPAAPPPIAAPAVPGEAPPTAAQ